VIPLQGEIWDTRFDPIEGHEQGGRRPALVISHNRFNRSASALCIVVPLTSRERGSSAEIAIEPPEGGVTAPSFILTNQIRTLSQSRMHRRRGTVRRALLVRVLDTIGHFIALSDEGR
jgi:mRNA interferase MazF